MQTSISLSGEVSNEILATLLSSNHGWWCDFIDAYVDKKGRLRHRLRNTPYYSPAFLTMYGYSREEMNLDAVVAPEFRHSVIREMKAAMQPHSEGISGTIVTRTRAGEEKLVEVYVRRIERPDGSVMLASLHSDLTISTDVQWIERTVLRRLQAFVFVKKWDESCQKFLFTHMNSKLSKTLGLASPDDAIGLSDEDFFEDEAQRSGFREVDEQIRDTNDCDLVVVREESFSPKIVNNPADGTTASRLLTFKTPFWPPSKGPRECGWEVLGIAVNVTHVTDVFRAIADQSEDGLYIKDSLFRYQYVNTKFLELLGAKAERQVLNRTFAEALRILEASGSISSKADVQSLESLVQEEDENVLLGGQTVSVRTASLHDGTEWLSEKRPIRTRDGIVTHILGVTSQLFPGKLGAVLDKIPQCLAVKKFSAELAGSDDEFKYVWANRSFLRLHDMQHPTDVLGKTDYDFWPAEQADKYRERDRQVIGVYRRVTSEAEWVALSDNAKWERLVQELRKHGCWEFREAQRGRGPTRVLQTTKWAVSIEGSHTLFLVVVYSDVSKGDAEQQRYHELTVHNIKGAIAPTAIAKMYLDRALNGTLNPFHAISEANECITDASDNVAFFLKHHLDLLRMNIQCVCHPVTDVIEAVKSEAEKATRQWDIPVLIDIDKAMAHGIAVTCDPVFLQFVLAELMLNAIKSIDRRSSKRAQNMHIARLVADADEAAADEYHGKVWVRFGVVDGRFSCVIADNGVACSDLGERADLEEAFGCAQNDPYEPYMVRLGLPFCIIAIQEQKGEILLKASDRSTEFKICLPLAVPFGG